MLGKKKTKEHLFAISVLFRHHYQHDPLLQLQRWQRVQPRQPEPGVLREEGEGHVQNLLVSAERNRRHALGERGHRIRAGGKECGILFLAATLPQQSKLQ